MENLTFTDCVGFEWDSGNSEKNYQKHGVSKLECEEIFFNQPIIVKDDEKHSKIEKRQYALGITNSQRMLYIVFTIRNRLIRVVSARDMSKKERIDYEKA